MLLLGRLTAAQSSSCLCKTKFKIKNSGTTKPLKEISALSVLLLLILLFPILLKSQIIIFLPLVLLLLTIFTVNMLTCHPRSYFRLKRSRTSGRCPRWLVFLKKLFYQDNCKEVATIRGGQISGAPFSFFVVKKCLFCIFRRLPSVSKMTPVSYYRLYCFGSIQLLCLHFVSINANFSHALQVLVIKGVTERKCLRDKFWLFSLNFTKFAKLNLLEKLTGGQFAKLNPQKFFVCLFVFQNYQNLILNNRWKIFMSKIFYRISKSIRREKNRKKNVNIFIISAPFDPLLCSLSKINCFISKYLQISKISIFQISKNLSRSSVTHILLAEEQTTTKSKYIRHW